MTKGAKVVGSSAAAADNEWVSPPRRNSDLCCRHCVQPGAWRRVECRKLQQEDFGQQYRAVWCLCQPESGPRVACACNSICLYGLGGWSLLSSMKSTGWALFDLTSVRLSNIVLYGMLVWNVIQFGVQLDKTNNFIVSCSCTLHWCSFTYVIDRISRTFCTAYNINFIPYSSVFWT